jgi:hypothetical protein
MQYSIQQSEKQLPLSGCFASILLNMRGSKRKRRDADLESLDHAFVVAPNNIDEDNKANLIKGIFKWPSFQSLKAPTVHVIDILSRCPRLLCR